MATVAPLLPGETLGNKYRIERVLGQGGMGIVVAARHLELDERVAIKFLLGAPSDRTLDRFLREARAAVKVKGEHVCRVFDFGRLETGEPYIVMEYLEGIDLAAKLKREGPQPIDRVVGWIVEICAALAEAHDQRIVHRDLKPANVFIATRPDGSTFAKVLDFGISKLPHVETITNPDAMMGSPVYMSPEQLESARDVDVRSDVWSLGVVMYELLAGRPPFSGDSMVELAVHIREKDPTPLEELRPEVPRALREIIARCLAKNARDRFSSVADLARDLSPFAPDDVAPVARRLARRTETIPSGEELALEATMSAETGSGPLQATFSPLQTSLDRTGRPDGQARRWPLLAAFGAGGALAAFVALRSASPAVAVAPEAAAPSGVTVLPEPSVPEPVTSSAVPVSSAVADAGPDPVSHSVAPPPPPRRVPREPAAQLSPTALPVVSSIPASDGPKPLDDGRKKRELDRDDP